jgi:hypothetical protein
MPKQLKKNKSNVCEWRANAIDVFGDTKELCDRLYHISTKPEISAGDVYWLREAVESLQGMYSRLSEAKCPDTIKSA